MNKTEISEYRRLKNAGISVGKENSVKFNAAGASETVDHIVAKSMVAMAGLRSGYRCSSEVEMKSGEIDILLWGQPDRLTLAVECETNPDDSVVEDKVDRYVRGTPIDDMALINVSTLPRDRMDAYREVTEVLGLDQH